MTKDGAFGEVLKAVFPLLAGDDLASCMLVCSQWRDIARDDYFWKCACAKKWPSIYRRQLSPSLNYHKLFLTFSRPHRPQPLLPPKLSFEDLEFYIDLWSGKQLIFSETVSGPVFQAGIKKNSPCQTYDIIRSYMTDPGSKLTMPVEPRLTISRGRAVTVSILVGRRDNNKIASIVDESVFDQARRNSFRVVAYDYLSFSPSHPFVSGVRTWVCLLVLVNDEDMEVFGIEIDFCDAACTHDEDLLLLDMLDWK